jgi:hypothetical protein
VTWCQFSFSLTYDIAPSIITIKPWMSNGIYPTKKQEVWIVYFSKKIFLELTNERFLHLLLSHATVLAIYFRKKCSRSNCQLKEPVVERKNYNLLATNLSERPIYTGCRMDFEHRHFTCNSKNPRILAPLIILEQSLKYRAIKLICNRVIHESEIVCRFLNKKQYTGWIKNGA